MRSKYLDTSRTLPHVEIRRVESLLQACSHTESVYTSIFTCKTNPTKLTLPLPITQRPAYPNKTPLTKHNHVIRPSTPSATSTSTTTARNRTRHDNNGPRRHHRRQTTPTHQHFIKRQPTPTKTRRATPSRKLQTEILHRLRKQQQQVSPPHPVHPHAN